MESFCRQLATGEKSANLFARIALVLPYTKPDCANFNDWRDALGGKMKTSICTLALSGLLITAAPGILQARDCQNSQLRDSYMGLGVGAVEIPNLPITGPFRRLFRAVFDGAGHIDITAAYSSFNGLIFGKDGFTGAYTVHADC